MVAIASRLTVEEFEQLPPAACRRELIKGELVEVNAASSRHGACANRIAFHLTAFVLPTGTGEVFVGDTGYLVSAEPATVRIPDVSFVAAERLAELGDPNRIARTVPDLAVEVVSPNDSWREVWEKAAMWLTAGVRLIWIVDPETQKVIALTPDAPPRTFTAGDQLDGGQLLPGFQVPVGEIFAF